MADDRLILRLYALRVARQRGNLHEGAWASQRLRLRGVKLDAADARFGRIAQIRFGHALRIARMNRGPREVRSLSFAGPGSSPTRRRWRWFAGLGAAAALVMLLVLLGSPSSSPSEDSAAVQRSTDQRAVPVASPLRGRSVQQQLVVAPIVAVASPTPRPTATPEDPEDRIGYVPGRPFPGVPTAGPGGGSGSGSGGGGTGIGIIPPTPTPQPTPSPDPATVMHLHGRVVEATGGQGVPGVCVAIGVVNCALSPITNNDGYWQIDLILGQVLAWDLKFVKAGYSDVQVRVPSKPGDVEVSDIRLLRF
jgi:hypothetical protein